jgi:hypothetical protein
MAGGPGRVPTNAHPESAVVGPVTERTAKPALAVPTTEDRVARSDTPDQAAAATTDQPPPAAFAQSRAVAPANRFASGYAGLLLLLNAFVALGLYPDFTLRRAGRLEPSPLWLVDRIARRWFGAAYRGDPLCRWIAEQGLGGRLPTRWAVEPDWLADFDNTGAPALVRRDRRVTIWHRDGFPLADGPAAAERRLRDSARRGGCVRRPAEAVRPHPRRSLPRTATERWTACLALYLDARIRLATGDAALGLSSLALAGDLRTSGLDLEVAFRLDAHPIGLRIAGLDRDPGWQPAEGRSIRFRFE